MFVSSWDMFRWRYKSREEFGVCYVVIEFPIFWTQLPEKLELLLLLLLWARCCVYFTDLTCFSYWSICLTCQLFLALVLYGLSRKEIDDMKTNEKIHTFQWDYSLIWWWWFKIIANQELCFRTLYSITISHIPYWVMNWSII